MTRLYGQVILDIQVQGLKDRLFTYAIPEHCADQAFVGAQVLVPFGPRQLVSGYLVSLSESSPQDFAFTIREIQEVVDPVPLFDEQYIEFLGYVAKRYCASLQDVIAAAIPSCLVGKVKRMVRLRSAKAAALAKGIGNGPAGDITEQSSKFMQQEVLAQSTAHKGGQLHLVNVAALQEQDVSQKILLKELESSAKGTLNITILRQRFEKAGKFNKPKLNASHFQKALKALSQAQLVEIIEEEDSATKMRTVALLTKGEVAPETARQKSIIAYVEELTEPISIPDLIEGTKASRSTIDKMVKANQLTLVDTEVVRESLGNLPQALIDKHRTPPPLTAEQSEVFAVLSKALKETKRPGDIASDGSVIPLESEVVKPWLLHGVTGSGKTEVYLRLITQCLESGRTTLFLVPEISLTPQLAGRLKARFGSLVSVWHSAISPGERYDTWRRLRSGEVKVLLGARSAVLANMPDLGLIVLDEEHDGSYKQSTPAPRYNARDLALEKARRTGALVLLGSATPDLTSYERALRQDRLLVMKNRVFMQVMPEVKVVDMRKAFAHDGKSVFSEELKKLLADRLAKGEQVVLLINRRGFANHVFCQGCGHVSNCKNCSVSLVLHSFKKARRADVSEEDYDDAPLLQAGGYLACHHCGFRQPLRDICSECDGPFLKVSGIGTQKVELEVLKLHPAARVVRLDSDVAKRKGAYEEVLAQFSSGNADVLIGTQMVAKGLDIPRVTLVGVLSADSAFNLPDYRSTERGFQLLTQVAGRAGRGEHPGAVVLQTYTPELPALRLASEHNYQAFYEPEIESRRVFDYPPYCSLIRLVVSGEDAVLVESIAELVAEELSHLLEDEAEENEVKILGPAPCIIERIKGRYRFHLIIKNKGGDRLQDLIIDYLRGRHFAAPVNLAVDVDALDLV